MNKFENEIMNDVIGIYEKYYNLNGMVDSIMLKETISDIVEGDENLYSEWIDVIKQNEKWKKMIDEKILLVTNNLNYYVIYIILLVLSVLTQKSNLIIFLVIVRISIFYLYRSVVKFIYQYHKKIYLDLMNKLSRKEEIHLKKTSQRLVYWLNYYINRYIISDIIILVISLLMSFGQKDNSNLISSIVYIMLLVDYIKQHFEIMNEINLEKIELDSKKRIENNIMYSFIIKIILKKSYKEKC